MITLDSRATALPPLAPAALARVPRFTLDGDEALEAQLAQTCARVLSGIRGLIPARNLEFVLLGGGYGRGEGGVLRGPTGDRPYNDLEFYVAIKGNRHLNEFRYRRRLEVLGEILSHLADVEIEFKITSLAELRRRPVSMFSYDLVVGHRVLWVHPHAEELPGCRHHQGAESIPEMEATRLLMNRCSGLLFARAELERPSLTPAAADFVRRNIAKVQLACGDAVLTALGRYHWSCRERHQRLQHLATHETWPWLDAVRKHHAAGVEFKLHPATDKFPHDTLSALHADVSALAARCWLHLESRRLGRAFPSVSAYACDAANKCPGANPLLNALLNARANGFRFRAEPNPWRHPRQRVFQSLALLLWEPATFTDPVLQRRVALELNLRDRPFTEWLPAYRALWARVQ